MMTFSLRIYMNNQKMMGAAVVVAVVVAAAVVVMCVYVCCDIYLNLEIKYSDLVKRIIFSTDLLLSFLILSLLK